LKVTRDSGESEEAGEPGGGPMASTCGRKWSGIFGQSPQSKTIERKFGDNFFVLLLDDGQGLFQGPQLPGKRLSQRVEEKFSENLENGATCTLIWSKILQLLSMYISI
jgi:hypothetical protein